jgi:rod shape-determining protein MreC
VALPAIHRRSGYLFAAVVVGQFLLISIQATTHTGVPLLQAAVFGVLAEVQRAGAGVYDTIGEAWGGYVALRGVRAENAELRHEIASLRVLLQQQTAVASESQRLHALLGLRDSAPVTTVAADVVGGGAAPDSRTLTINLGALDGVRADMAVIAPEGVVGRIVLTGARVAKVQLLVDGNAASGVRTDRTAAEGIALGGQDGLLRLDYVSPTAEIAEGDTVRTSGLDGIYPKGFIVGTITQVERVGGIYRRILVRPAVDFTRLDHVLVVTSPKAAREEPS